METDGSRPTPHEARAALDTVTESRKSLAPFVRSPRWLYPVQGLATAAMLIGLPISLTDYAVGTGLLAFAIIVFSVLPMAQHTPGRVVFDVYTHRGSWRFALLYVIPIILLMVAVLVFHPIYEADWFVYLAAAIGFLLTVVMGPMLDTRLEHAVRAGL
ncbi:MAG TPA: hypothetical protein VGP24_02540 [Glaciihabitans sp.]|nr:hypothetical protein [Glaciihabitans sp.]